MSTSLPAHRDQLLETRVRELGAYVLSLRCHPGCEWPGHLPLGPLVARQGGLQLRALLSKLRCSRCKRRPAAVTLLDHITDGQPPSLRVQVLP